MGLGDQGWGLYKDPRDLGHLGQIPYGCFAAVACGSRRGSTYTYYIVGWVSPVLWNLTVIAILFILFMFELI